MRVLSISILVLNDMDFSLYIRDRILLALVLIILTWEEVKEFEVILRPRILVVAPLFKVLYSVSELLILTLKLGGRRALTGVIRDFSAQVITPLESSNCV